MESLKAALPDTTPRFVVMCLRLERGEGRVTFPLVFMFYIPSNAAPQWNMLYTRGKLQLMNRLSVTKGFDLREAEELSPSWVEEQVRKITR